MKIVLIQPPIEDFYITRQRLQPVNLLYIASYLESKGYNVKIFDFLFPLIKQKIPLDKELQYLETYYERDISPLKIFTDYYHFGAGEKEIIGSIKKEKFDIYGIASNFTAYYKESLKIAKIIKTCFPLQPVIIGGHNSRIMYEFFLKSGFVDIVIFGEGERTFHKVLQNLKKPDKVENIAFIKNKRIIITKQKKNFNINDSLIKLDYINPEKYKIGKYPGLSLITSRGCPYNCAFCTVHINCLSGFQIKDTGLLFKEIDYNIKKFNISALNIEDENFSFNKEHAVKFLEYKIKKYPDLRLYFMNGLCYKDLDDELLCLLKKANVNNLNLALVDRKNEKILRRGFDEEKFIQVIQTAEKLNFLIIVHFIAGLPGQTRRDILKIIDFLYDLKVIIGLSVYYPIPLTGLHERYLELYKNIKYVQMRSTALACETDVLSRQDLVSLLRYVRYLNFTYGFCEEPVYKFRVKNNYLIYKTCKKSDSNEIKTVMLHYFLKEKKMLILKKIEYKNENMLYYFKKAVEIL